MARIRSFPLSRPVLLALLLGTTGALALVGATGAIAQQAQASFDIPPSSLSEALIVFGRQSGLQVSFAPALTEGLASPGTSGPATTEGALSRLLQGTGLDWRYAGPNTVTIVGPADTGLVGGEIPSLFLGTIIYGDRMATTLDETRASVAVVAARPDDAPAPQTLDDAYRLTANVNAGDWNASGFVIRGINSEGLVPGGAGQPLASLYVDGVQQTVEGVRQGVRGMFDMEQAEIYRGPQSTLSGRAALAGAVYLRSTDPAFEAGGTAQLSFGTDNLRQGGIAFGGPISDNLAYRISAEYSEQQSPLDFSSYERFDAYEDFITDEYYTLRGKLLWLPGGSDATRVLLSYSHSFDRPTSLQVAGPGWSLNSPGYGGLRGDIWGDLTPDSYRWFLAGMAVPDLALLPPEMQQAIVYSQATELSVFQEMRRATVDNFGIEVTHDISDALRLTALTGLSRSITDRNSINFGEPGATLYTEGRFTQEILSQELRLNYAAGNVEAVAGLYAARLHNEAWRNSLTLSFEESRNTIDIDNVALFGQVRYDLTPDWALIAGGRLDWISQNQTNWYRENFGAENTSDPSYSDAVFLPLVGIEHGFGNGQTISVVYQEGYRPGGAGYRVSPDPAADFVYDPEFTHTLELAWRGSFLDNRLSVAANAFYQDWRGQQVEVLLDPTDWDSAQIVNAGRSESYGAEIELAYAATDLLNLRGSLGLLHTEFTDFNLPLLGLDMTGSAFPGAPDHTISLGFRWGDTDGPFVGGQVNRVGESLSRIEGNGIYPYHLDGYTTVDLEFGYVWNDLQFTAYATNLFDERYFLYEGPFVNPLSGDRAADAMATIGDPREIGFRVDYRF